MIFCSSFPNDICLPSVSREIPANKRISGFFFSLWGLWLRRYFQRAQWSTVTRPRPWNGATRAQPSPQGCGDICGGTFFRAVTFNSSVWDFGLFSPFVCPSRYLLFLSAASCALPTKALSVTQIGKAKSRA